MRKSSYQSVRNAFHSLGILEIDGKLNYWKISSRTFMPAFKPVLEILDNELPEYANLAQEKTGKIHCKAVRKLNEIQPTTVRDEEKYRIRRSKISAKLLAAATPPYFARMVM